MAVRVIDRALRDEIAKTYLRSVEKELLVEIAEECDITPSEVTRLAIIDMILRCRPEKARAAGIRRPGLAV